jgi:peptidoglycan L-alanyl-D-glutamate endopeptidase CwlK
MFSKAAQANVARFFPLIEAAFARFHINDKELKLVGYATIRAESARFAPVKEGEYYSNRAKHVQGNTLAIPDEYRLWGEASKYNLYEFRQSLGNTAFGDGAKFMGRGFIQLTGRQNYSDIGNMIHEDLVNHPELANEPRVAANVVAAYIQRHRHAISAALQSNNLHLVRKLVNGGSNGIQDFLQAYRQGMALITASDRKAVGSIA